MNNNPVKHETRSDKTIGFVKAGSNWTAVRDILGYPINKIFHEMRLSNSKEGNIKSLSLKSHYEAAEALLHCNEQRKICNYNPKFHTP